MILCLILLLVNPNNIFNSLLRPPNYLVYGVILVVLVVLLIILSYVWDAYIYSIYLI